MTASASSGQRPLEPALLRASGMELTLAAQGMSMLPLIRAGDRLRIRCGEPSDLQPGQIVLFLRDGDAVVHRLVEIDPSSTLPFYEQGDAVTRGSWISRDAVIGVLVAINDQPVPLAPAAARILARLERRMLPWVPRRLRASPCLARMLRATKALLHRPHART